MRDTGASQSSRDRFQDYERQDFIRECPDLPPNRASDVSLGKAREAWEVTLALSERFQRPRENGEPGCCARRFSGRIAGLSRQVPAAQPVGAAAEHCTVKEDARGQRMKIKNGVEDTYCTVRISWEGED
jgi:hypothetical protein